MRSRLAAACVMLYGLLCLGVVWVSPLNGFEWMLTDPVLATDSPNFCTLPQDDRLATALFPLAFVLPLVVLGILAWVLRRARWICALATITLGLWFCRFVVFYPECPELAQSSLSTVLRPSALAWTGEVAGRAEEALMAADLEKIAVPRTIVWAAARQTKEQ